LGSLEKIILIEALATYDRRIGNAFRLTAVGISKQHQCAPATARRALQSLQEKGWIERIGLRPGPSGQIGGVYRITALTEVGYPARGPFEQWEPK
jgi:predicted transcriptional regulator of viral defense system